MSRSLFINKIRSYYHPVWESAFPFSILWTSFQIVKYFLNRFSWYSASEIGPNLNSQSPIVGHLGCSKCFPIKNNMTINILIAHFFHTDSYSLLGYIPRNRISSLESMNICRFMLWVARLPSRRVVPIHTPTPRGKRQSPSLGEH